MTPSYKITSHEVLLLAETLEKFFLKQKAYLYGLDAADEKKGEIDRKLSSSTLNKIRDTADLLFKAGSMVAPIEYLMTGEYTEYDFRTRWKDEKLG